MLAKVIALVAHEVIAEYRLLSADDPEPEPPAPPDAKIKIGFSNGRNS